MTTNVAARCSQDSVTSYNIWEDPQISPLGTGDRNQVGVQVSGGTDAVRYYVDSLPFFGTITLRRKMQTTLPSWL